MNSFVVILSCLAAVSLANPTQDLVVEFLASGRTRCRSGNCGNRIGGLNNCPPSTCPPPNSRGQCGEPDCNNHLPNRAWLHAHRDPKFYYQCRPSIEDPSGNPDRDIWMPEEMPCACGTLFMESANRCEHIEDWYPTCTQHPRIAPNNPCQEDCGPTCNGPNTPPQVTSPPEITNPTPPTVPTTAPSTPPPSGCICPCVPCIWWPCQPCQPTACACNDNQAPRNPPQNPWSPPMNPQHPWAPLPSPW